MQLELNDRRVIVTAAGNGIGLQIARAFIAEGARVCLCDVDEEALESVRESLSPTLAAVCDVTDRSAVDDFIRASVDALGGLDVLVNNAGNAGPTARIEDIDPHDWERCIAVCLGGQFHCTRRAVPHLRAAGGGSIINLSSAAGRFGFALRSPYAAAKWGVIGLTKSLAIELGPDRIRVNAILPGIVAGDRQRRVLESKAQQRGLSFTEIEAEAFSYSSIPDYVTAEDIANQILFLTSDCGKSITGQALSVCNDLKMLA